LIYFQGQTENVNQPNGIEEGALGLFFSSSINSQMGSSLIFFLYSILIERNGPRKRVGKKELAATFLQVDIYLFIYI
jgi:hypothetical protein